MRKRRAFRAAGLDRLEDRVVLSTLASGHAVHVAAHRSAGSAEARASSSLHDRPVVLHVAKAEAAASTPTSRIALIGGSLPSRYSGTARLVFTVFATGKGGSPLYRESQAVAVHGGKFQAYLGRGTVGGLPAALAVGEDSLYVAVSGPARPRRQVGARIPLASSAFTLSPTSGPQGPAGPEGATGATGPVGAQGATGPVGPQGSTGASGVQGVAGDAGAQGSAGPQGDPGAVGPQGPAGAQGPTGGPGATGSQGATGSPGPAGAQGPTGAQGPAGPQGPTGVVQTAFNQGAVATPGASYSFLGPTVDVTVADGDVISVVSSATMGSFLSLGAGGLTLGIAYSSGGGAPVAVTQDSGLSVGPGTKSVFTLNGLIAGLPAGTYTVGLAGRTIDPQWTNNDLGATTAMVLRA